MLANQNVSEPRVAQIPIRRSPSPWKATPVPASPSPRYRLPGRRAGTPSAWNKFQDEVGGNLRAGDPGRRLLEPGEGNLGWFGTIPAPSSPPHPCRW
jgi:NADH-quinone oxidoreductase subunit G